MTPNGDDLLDLEHITLWDKQIARRMEEVCQQYGLDRTDPPIRGNLKRIIQAEIPPPSPTPNSIRPVDNPKGYCAVPPNEAMFDSDLLRYEGFPTAVSEVRALVLCYKHFIPDQVFKNDYGFAQGAAVLQALRRKGFMMLQSPKRKGFMVRRSDVPPTIVTPDTMSFDLDYLYITGFDQDTWFSEQTRSTSLINRPAGKKLLARHPQCALCKTPATEVDHRCPTSRARGGSAELRAYDTESERAAADRDFQPICKSCNSEKREACKKCMAGKEIPFPQGRKVTPLQEVLRPAYKQKWTDGGEDCTGCVWFNPLFPRHKHSVEELLAKWGGMAEPPMNTSSVSAPPVNTSSDEGEGVDWMDWMDYGV